MVGVVGVTVIAVGVGLTKNPVQLTANASVASAAKAPINRSLDLVEDMVLKDSLGARRSVPNGVFLPALSAKIVAEKIWPGAHSGT
jgi:hypothetical protein